MQPTPGLDSMTYQEMSEILEEEIGQLPDKYASVLVLCYLEGKTNAQAAALLGCPEGSMSRRLSRARELLRARLTKRGLALSAMLMAAVFSRPAAGQMSPLLTEATARAAGLAARGVAMEEIVAPTTAELVHDVLQGMPAAGKLAFWGIAAIGAVLLALTVILRQWDVPAYGIESGGGAAVQGMAEPSGCSLTGATGAADPVAETCAAAP